jgi:hypothetical protein
MKKQIYIAFAILMVLGFVGSALAFWPFTENAVNGDAITGYANLDVSLDMSNTNICIDSDEGVKLFIPGTVLQMPSTIKKDSCVGKKTSIVLSDGKKIEGTTMIREYYCNGDVVTFADYDKNSPISADGTVKLGDGLCVISKDDSTKGLAYWRTASKVCHVLPNNKGVVDQNGKKWMNGCGAGNKNKVLITYSCNPTTNEVVPNEKDCSTADGFGACNNEKKSCGKSCLDSDPNNDKNTPGMVTFDGKTYLDQCNLNNKNQIRQFKCVKGEKQTVMNGDSQWVSCGTNRECILGAEGAYCKDKYASVNDKERLDNLYEQVNGLLDRIERLECQLNPPTVSTDSCCTILTDLAICQQVTEPETSSEGTA